MSQSKRRRISSDEQPNVIQPAVVGSSSPTSEAEELDIVPKLAELPKIMMVDLHKDNVEDVDDAMKRLKKLLTVEDPDDDNDEGVKNRKVAINLGMIGTIVFIMKKWPENESIQSKACYCLARLAYVDAADVAVVGLGGIEAVVNAMKRFQGSRHVQNHCLWVLRNVLSADDDEEQPIQDVTKRFVEEFDGLTLANKAMESFPNEASIQRFGCGLFHNLALSGKYRDALLKAGAVSAVGKAAEQHPGHEKINESTTDFMALMFPKKKKK